LLIASWQDNVLELNPDKGLKLQDGGLVWRVQLGHLAVGGRECKKPPLPPAYFAAFVLAYVPFGPFET
jgi:hypothetical protein